MSLPQFEGNEPDATITSQQKTVCCKIFHKATAVVPVIFDGYETLSIINGGKKPEGLPDRMLNRCLDLGGKSKLHNNEHHNLHSLFNSNTMIK
jgi:hypothetical protein